MTTHEGAFRVIQQNKVTALTGGNYGQNVVLPLLQNRAFPNQKVLVVTRNKSTAELLRGIFNELSSKHHNGNYLASTKLESKANTIFQSSFKIYKLLLEGGNLKDLELFSFVFIDEVNSGTVETDLLFGLFLNKMKRLFKGKIVLNGRTVNYPYEAITYYQINNVNLESSQNPFIIYHNRTYNPTNRLNRRMYTEFSSFIVDKLDYNIINEKIAGNVVVFLPGIGEIKFVHEQLKDKVDRMKIIEISGKDLTKISNLYVSRGQLILTTNVIHSILGIPNVRLVFDSMYEKSPVVMQNGVSLIQTTRITKQEAKTRAMMAYKNNNLSFGYVFRFTTKKGYEMLSEAVKEKYSKESLYSQVLDFNRHNIPVKILGSIANMRTIGFAVQDLEKYGYLENNEVMLDYTQTFGLAIERIYSNFLADKPTDLTNEKLESYHFCFIAVCVLVSEFRYGYFSFPRTRNERDLGKVFQENFQIFEGQNELLTYLNVIVKKYFFVENSYKNMKENIDKYCREYSLNTEEVKRVFVKLKQITDLESIRFKPTVLSENDYIRVARSFANYYALYKPESVFEKKNQKYVYETGQNKFFYIHDKFYTGIGLDQRSKDSKIIVFNGKSIERKGASGIDGFIRFYVPFTDDYTTQKTVKLILLPTPLNNFDMSNLQPVSWGEFSNTQLPEIYNDPFFTDYSLHAYFLDEKVTPVYSKTKDKIIQRWEKNEYYPLRKEPTNILEYDIHLSTYNNEEYVSDKFNTQFYNEILMEQIYLTINIDQNIDRIHFDLAQEEIVQLPFIKGTSPDEKWVANKKELIESSIVQSNTGFSLDSHLLEQNIGPFFSYPTITALTGLVSYLFNPEDTINIFEYTSFLGELLFVALRKNVASYQAVVGVKVWEELYLDLLQKTVGWIPEKNETWKDVLFDRTNERFQITKSPAESNLFLMRFLQGRETRALQRFDKYIYTALAWVVLWIADPREHVNINQKVSEYSFLSYYGTIRFSENQFFWVYSVVGANEEAFGFE